jgi:transcription termination factor Rho
VADVASVDVVHVSLNSAAGEHAEALEPVIRKAMRLVCKKEKVLVCELTGAKAVVWPLGI